MKQLQKKIEYSYAIEVLTGLHIGGSKDSVEIGGIDLPVVKLPLYGDQPYIPGSSLKGKMRCLLEQANGMENPKAEGKVEKETNLIRSLFGVSEITKKIDGEQTVVTENQPSRLIVRDAKLSEASVKKLKDAQDRLDMPYTESKYENTVNRITGKAESPRQIERVPAGVEFDATLILNIWEGDDEEGLKDLLHKGIEYLQLDYLGGNGSRGYGQVKFHLKSGEKNPEEHILSK